MNALPIVIPEHLIEEFCVRNHIRKLSLFGSVLAERFRAESDVDVLVEFEPDKIPGLFDLVGMEQELAQIVGRKVDLRTTGDLSRHFLEEVVASATVSYGRRCQSAAAAHARCGARSFGDSARPHCATGGIARETGLKLAWAERSQRRIHLLSSRPLHLCERLFLK